MNAIYPVNYLYTGMELNTAAEFDGIWVHSVDVNTWNHITTNGWNPSLNKGTIYGTAVYLSRENWYPTRTNYCLINCKLNLSTEEVQSFETAQTLIQQLRSSGLNVGMNSSNGNSPKNLSIMEYFLSRGIKAVRFLEHGSEVVAAYDPSCIYVV